MKFFPSSFTHSLNKMYVMRFIILHEFLCVALCEEGRFICPPSSCETFA